MEMRFGTKAAQKSAVAGLRDAYADSAVVWGANSTTLSSSWVTNVRRPLPSRTWTHGAGQRPSMICLSRGP